MCQECFEILSRRHRETYILYFCFKPAVYSKMCVFDFYYLTHNAYHKGDRIKRNGKGEGVVESGRVGGKGRERILGKGGSEGVVYQGGLVAREGSVY